MKKAINVLSISSGFVIVLLIALDAIWSNKGQRMGFILLWSDFVLFFFAIPIVFGWFSLAFNKDKIKPKVWLIIYGVALIGYIAILGNIGFVGMTKDLPLAIREDYSQINGKVKIISNIEATRTVEVKGIMFIIQKDTFNAMSSNENYTFIYLPNSNSIIDIIDENGKSLSML